MRAPSASRPSCGRHTSPHTPRSRILDFLSCKRNTMQLRSSFWTAAVLAGLVAQPAGAEPSQRTFDILTYTAPDGWKVNEETARGLVSISRATSTFYCMTTIYASTPAVG